MEKLPPIEKIPEAWSAIADGRVVLHADHAEVRSSEGEKTYLVRWEGDTYSSTDNATTWQGYAGYPVLAVLMLQGRLPLEQEIAAYFRGINWSGLNSRLKRNYSAALAEVLEGLRQDGVDVERITREMQHTYSLLPALPIATKRGSSR